MDHEIITGLVAVRELLSLGMTLERSAKETQDETLEHQLLVIAGKLHEYSVNRIDGVLAA